MALIDNTENNQITTCIKCKDNQLPDKPIVLFCESCFKDDIDLALNQIKEQVAKFYADIKKIDDSISKIKDEIKSKPNDVLNNKYEIDIISLEAVREKILIDIKTNKKAYILNQEFANKIRENCKWKTVAITSIDHFEG